MFDARRVCFFPLRASSGAFFSPTHRMQLLSRSETARRLGVSVDTVKRLCISGKLLPCRIGRRVLFTEATIDAFIAANQSLPPQS